MLIHTGPFFYERRVAETKKAGSSLPARRYDCRFCPRPQDVGNGIKRSSARFVPFSRISSEMRREQLNDIPERQMKLDPVDRGAFLSHSGLLDIGCGRDSLDGDTVF